MSFMHMGTVTAASEVGPDPLGVIVSPSSIFATDPNCPLTSVPFTGTGFGGTAPFTYAWDFQVGGAGMTIDSPSSQVTTVTVSGGGFRSGTLRCTVTDDATDTSTDVASVSMECGLL